MIRKGNVGRIKINIKGRKDRNCNNEFSIKYKILKEEPNQNFNL